VGCTFWASKLFYALSLKRLILQETEAVEKISLGFGVVVGRFFLTIFIQLLTKSGHLIFNFVGCARETNLFGRFLFF
jgi:hypothetical protein